MLFVYGTFDKFCKRGFFLFSVLGHWQWMVCGQHTVPPTLAQFQYFFAIISMMAISVFLNIFYPTVEGGRWSK